MILKKCVYGLRHSYHQGVKYLLFLCLSTSSIAEILSADILTNAGINERFGIRIEITEKSIQPCNDIVIFAPLEIQKSNQNVLTLGEIASSLHATEPSVSEVLESGNAKRYDYELVGGNARVLSCVNRPALANIYFRFQYVGGDSSSVVLVAPLM